MIYTGGFGSYTRSVFSKEEVTAEEVNTKMLVTVSKPWPNFPGVDPGKKLYSVEASERKFGSIGQKSTIPPLGEGFTSIEQVKLPIYPKSKYSEFKGRWMNDRE